jgi:Uncharacterized conserved protein
MNISYTFASIVIGMLLAAPASALPKYKADVPASIITPDKVRSEFLGDLEFIDGFPKPKTVALSYRFLDVMHAVQLFELGMPTSSMYALLHGHREIGIKPNYSIGVTEQLMDARSLWLTPNTTTPYIHAEVDVKNGPVVIEVNSPVIGILDDAWFQYVGDIGLGGPDGGKGGKYLVVGHEFKGVIPEGYFVLKTNTYRHWLLIRAAGKPGESVEQTLNKFKSGFKLYPLAKRDSPPKNEYINLSGKKYNTIHATNAKIYDELNAAIQYEPINSGSPEMLGLAKSLGISKGHPFEPDKRMKKILDEASKIGNAAFRSVMYKPRNKAAYFYPDRKWFSPLAGGSYEFLDDNGARALDDMVGFHFYATGVTPFMVQPKVGAGSVYEVGTMDNKGNPLDGGKTYSVTLPGPIPAKDFWSFMAYDNHTRSILETDQRSGGIDSKRKSMVVGKDGSVTIYFGPAAPVGQENNWVQTVSGKGYNVLLRLYGPLQPWFDRSWKPSDFTVVE